MKNACLTYFATCSGKKVYSIPEAIELLNNDEPFYMVCVIENGDTRRTSKVTNIDGRVISTINGSIYNIVGMDLRRFTVTPVYLISFKIIQSDKTEYTTYDVQEAFEALFFGSEVKAMFTVGSGEIYVSGPIVTLNIEDRIFETVSEHRYKF